MSRWTAVHFCEMMLLISVCVGADVSKAPATQPAASKTLFPTPAELTARLKAAKDEVAAATEPASLRVAYFDLGRQIVEKPADFSIFANDQNIPLHDLLDRLEKARRDSDIKAVLLTAGGQINLSQALEVRDALAALHKAGKRTFVYADTYDAPTYIMASGATDLCILGGGDIELPGVGLQTIFAKGLFDKIGVEADYEQIGEFKGADEEFIHTKPSPEMAGELNNLVDSFYAQLIGTISHDRNLSPDAVKRLVDQALIPAEEAKKAGLVDHLIDVDGLRDLIGDQVGGKIDLIHDYGQDARPQVDFSNPFALLSLFTHKEAASGRQAVALIYAEGVIVDGSAQSSLFSSSAEIGSDDIREALRLAQRDDEIGAVVIRIDSPGGSALASEAMWQAVRRAQKVKPVIVSVGSMAASGGYYLASSSDYIYADPTAIVGSIGVVGGKFVLKDLFEKLGLSTATFQRGANAGLFDSTTPWTEAQRKMIHEWMKQTYDQFTQRVMTTRTGKIKDIDKVARGRIFLAPQAKDLGLVDALGGLSDAIGYAANKAHLAPDSYEVRVLPAPKTLADLINGGAETQINLQPRTMAGDSLLAILPAGDRAMLQEQITLLQLFESHPVALISPYIIGGR